MMSTSDTVTIAAYNIQSGGFSDYSKKLSLPPERLQVIKTAIGMFHADFVGLIDTYRWETEFKPENLTAEFGFTYVKSISLQDEIRGINGEDTGLTILTKLPVVYCDVIKIANRNALLTTVRIGNNDLDIFTVYLDYLSEEVRLNQIKELLRQVRLDRPTIIMGDLNAISPREQIRFSNFLAGFSTKYPQLIFQIWPKVLEMLKGKVINYILANGFHDGAIIKKPTVPTKLPNYPLRRAALRLDYAFANKLVDISNLTVPQDEIFDRASDHYPIVFDVYLNDIY
jgi:endonuclease/exonuclease/phosphatase family metal-dependent hydrolase